MMNLVIAFTLGFAAAILLVWAIFWVAKQDT
jgi:high-affinity Fe2+/Pb2+ permease